MISSMDLDTLEGINEEPDMHWNSNKIIKPLVFRIFKRLLVNVTLYFLLGKIVNIKDAYKHPRKLTRVLDSTQGDCCSYNNTAGQLRTLFEP